MSTVRMGMDRRQKVGLERRQKQHRRQDQGGYPCTHCKHSIRKEPAAERRFR